ncbi:hypothetical protein Tco_0199063 [Tanacetum coccineum]
MENNVDRSKHDALNKLDGVAEGLLERIRRSRALRASESDVNPKPLKSILKRSIQSPIAKDNNGVRKVSMNPTTMVWEVETDYASPIRNADESGFQPSLTSERVGSTHTNAHENVVTADKGVSNATGLADSSSKQQGGPNANEPMADANIVGASMDASDTNSLTNATKQAAGPKVNTSFASVIKSNQNKVVQITEHRNEEHMEGAAVTIPFEEVSSRFANTLYGYFVGKRLAFLLVENYVQIRQRSRRFRCGLNFTMFPLLLTQKWDLVSAEDAPKEELVIAIPLGKDKGHSLATIRIEYEWTPYRGFTLNHSKDVADDGFEVVKKKRNKKKKHQKQVDNLLLTCTQSKNVRLENSFNALNDDEDNEWKDNTTWRHSQQVLDVLNESDSEVDEVITLDDRGGNLKTF